MDKLFRQELRYPPEAVAEGDVLLFLGVLADGTVSELRVWRSLDPACDAEALRVARMIRWHPATMAGEQVGAEHYLVVPFRRKRIKRWTTERRRPEDTVFVLPADTGLFIHPADKVDRPAQPALDEGWAGLGGYLGAHMAYPPDALRRDIDGVVEVEFVVEPSGTLSNMRAVRELGAGCNEEAFRLVSGIGWIPAVHQGSRVRTAARVRMRFRLPR